MTSFEEDISKYALRASESANKVQVTLHRTGTNCQYIATFTSTELVQACKFPPQLAGNISRMINFINSVPDSNNNLKWRVFIDPDIEEDADHNDDKKKNPNDKVAAVEGGIHGIGTEEFEADDDSDDDDDDDDDDVEYAMVKIIKPDGYFGDMEYVMKLRAVPRKPSDIMMINAQRIDELQQELRLKDEAISRLQLAVKRLEDNDRARMQQIASLAEKMQRLDFLEKQVGDLILLPPEKQTPNMYTPRRSDAIGNHVDRDSVASSPAILQADSIELIDNKSQQQPVPVPVAHSHEWSSWDQQPMMMNETEAWRNRQIRPNSANTSRSVEYEEHEQKGSYNPPPPMMAVERNHQWNDVGNDHRDDVKQSSSIIVVDRAPGKLQINNTKNDGKSDKKKKSEAQVSKCREIVCTFHHEYVPDVVALCAHFSEFGKITNKPKIENDRNGALMAKIRFKSPASVDKVTEWGPRHSLLSEAHHTRVSFRVYRADDPECTYRELNPRLMDMIIKSKDKNFGDFVLQQALRSHCGSIKLFNFKLHDCTKQRSHECLECTYYHGDEYKQYEKYQRLRPSKSKK